MESGTTQQKQKSKPATSGNDENFTFLPLADVQIRANETVAKTDAAGNFLLRNLPAGKVAISLVATKPLPEGLKLPSGELNLPADPIQVQGASIVISNPDLIPYLTTQPLPKEPGVPPNQSAPILQGKALPADPAKSARNSSVLNTQPAQHSDPVAPSLAATAKPALSATSAPTVSTAGSIATTKLPSSIASGQIAEIAVVKPVPPAVGISQTASWGVTKTIDCSNLPSLGETARCYAQMRSR
jgi:hypothetical protein